jgi:hypothetical protein
MLKTDTPIGRFFDLYAHQTAEGDIPAIVSHFADTFLFAGPSGTQPVRASDFAAALPRRKLLFDKLGSQPTLLTAVHETPLDSRYVLVRTTWRFSFLRDGIPAQHLDADSTFLIDTGLPGTSEPDFKILLYLTHQDIMQLLHDRGILSA